MRFPEPEMDRQKLEEIEGRVRAATPGPWRVGYHRGFGEEHDLDGPPDGVRAQFGRLADARFVAAAREDVPELIEALRAAYERIEELQEKNRQLTKTQRDTDYR